MYTFKVTVSNFGAVFCDGIQVRESNIYPSFTATEIGTAIIDYISFLNDMQGNPFMY